MTIVGRIAGRAAATGDTPARTGRKTRILDRGSNSAVQGGSIEGVIESFHGVRAALAELLMASGADPTKTRDSARRLGLNRGLAWRVSRIIRSEDIRAAASDVPSRASMEKVILACRDRGAPEATVITARKAIEEFEAAVGRFSGDRKTLAMAMAGREDPTPSVELERSRRKLFEGACSVWGVQAQVRFVTVFLFPSHTNPERLDVGHATGYVDFRRLRSIPWPMSYEGVHQKEGQPVPFQKEPLDPEGSSEGELQIISQFCKPAQPKIQVVEGPTMKRFELAPGPVGNAGMTTCVFGTYLRELLSKRPSEDHDFAGFYVLLQTPVERVIFDIYVHEDVGFTDVPETFLLDRLTHSSEAREYGFERETLPLAEQAFRLGRGASGAVTPHIPWYPKLIEFMGERIGHAPDAFLGSRFQMTYPPIPTALHRRFPLPSS